MKMHSEIIVPVYNPKEYIIEQIQSIYSQTVPCCRLTISDDLSVNDTQSLLGFLNTEKIEFKLHIQNIRLGLIDNINFLLENCYHSYIFFCDQDDVWLPHKIEISLRKMLEIEIKYGSNTPILVHTDLMVVDQDLNLIHTSFQKYQNLDPNPSKLLPRLLVQNFVTGCTMLINEPLKKLVTPIPSEAIMHDWWIALVAATLGKIAYIPEPTLLYRQHQNNTIGARRWGIGYMLSRLNNLDKIKSDIQKTLIQTQKFRETFQSQLSTEQLDVIDTYINLPNLPWLIRKYLMINNGYYQLGKLRNLGFLYCI